MTVFTEPLCPERDAGFVGHSRWRTALHTFLGPDAYQILQDALDPFEGVRCPDKVIELRDRQRYLFRWHCVRIPELFGQFIHLTVSDDDDRWPHDHPWDNMSVVLAGGYVEYCYDGTKPIDNQMPNQFYRTAGDTVFRQAEALHLLKLHPAHKYALTSFTTGPRRREWGFQTPDAWVLWQEHIYRSEE